MFFLSPGSSKILLFWFVCLFVFSARKGIQGLRNVNTLPLSHTASKKLNFYFTQPLAVQLQSPRTHRQHWSVGAFLQVLPNSLINRKVWAELLCIILPSSSAETESTLP